MSAGNYLACHDGNGYAASTRNAGSFAAAMALTIAWAGCEGSLDHHRVEEAGRGGMGATAGTDAQAGGLPMPADGGLVPSSSAAAQRTAQMTDRFAAEQGRAAKMREWHGSKRDILDTTLEINVATRRSRETITLAPSGVEGGDVRDWQSRDRVGDRSIPVVGPCP